MNAVLAHAAYSALLLLADGLPAHEIPAAAQRVAIGNAAVENWLQALEGRRRWGDGGGNGELELRPVARGLALAGRGTEFAAGSESSWLILWDAANRQLVTTVISSSGEYHLATQAVSASELCGKFTGTSDSADGLRSVRGECTWKRTSSHGFSMVWKSWFIADQGQTDRQINFQRNE